VKRVCVVQIHLPGQIDPIFSWFNIRASEARREPRERLKEANGETPVERPPSDAYRNEGVLFNSTDNPDFNYNQNAPLEEIRVQIQEGQVETKEELRIPTSSDT